MQVAPARTSEAMCVVTGYNISGYNVWFMQCNAPFTPLLNPAGPCTYHRGYLSQLYDRMYSLVFAVRLELSLNMNQAAFWRIQQSSQWCFWYVLEGGWRASEHGLWSLSDIYSVLFVMQRFLQEAHCTDDHDEGGCSFPRYQPVELCTQSFSTGI